MTTPTLLTPSVVAARWSVSARTVKRLIADGALRGWRVGNQWRTSEEAIAEYERAHAWPPKGRAA